jgi:hypothetical protein
MSNHKRDPSCEDCKHYVPDPTYPRATSYGRCLAPKARETGAPHFAAVNRSSNGRCAGGVLFEGKGDGTVTV